VRARQKGNSRKKIINGLKLHAVMLQDPTDIYHITLGDLYYDKINRIDLLEEAAQRSRELFSTALIRSSEITQDAGVKVDSLSMEQHVYIERPKTPGAAPTAQRMAVPVQRTATTTQTTTQRAEVRQTVTVKKDGLSEL
jgi:hypothetical protein